MSVSTLGPVVVPSVAVQPVGLRHPPRAFGRLDNLKSSQGGLRHSLRTWPVHSWVSDTVHQTTDLLEDCQKLLERFKYPWEMMPLMYAILKDARADLEEASRRIDEGQAAEILLNICQRIKDKFQLPWRMISLVDVILKYAKENQDDAWSRIEEAFLEFRALAAVEAARYTYHHIPYPGLYSTAAAALYPPVYLPSMSIYHHPPSIFSAPTCSSPTSHSPPAGSTPVRPGSRT
nr:protein doublesex-like [Leptinotarsa decemlineata]